MPRMRTIKPEFFRSPDVAAVEPHVRLFYIALWCWADDFGVGETNINGLLGFAFPDDDQISDGSSRGSRAVSAQDVRRFCADVAQHFGITFYEVRGRHYFAIPTWDKHQKTERREDRRKHPLPTDPEATPDLRFHPGADSAPEVRRETGAESALEVGSRKLEVGSSNSSSTAAPSKDRFDEFWLAYPRKVGKGAAIKAWKTAAKKAADQLIIEAASAFAITTRGQDQKFVPHPATWLNAERWADDDKPVIADPQRDMHGKLMIGGGW